MFFSPFSIAITSLGEETANLSAFRTFVQFVLVWFCRFPLPLSVWEGLQFVIVAFPGFFSYPFLAIDKAKPPRSLETKNTQMNENQRLSFIKSLNIQQCHL